MKVLLVRPILLNPQTVCMAMDTEPLELEYLYTACRQIGAEPILYDGITETRKFSDVLKEFSPDITAVTGYITQENVMKRYSVLVKKVLPSCRVIFGGVHAQLNYRRLYFKSVDFIQRSESMQDFQQLLTAIRDKKSYETINGLCWWSSNGFVENAFLPCDMNLLPIPERPCLQKNLNLFRYLDLQGVATLKTAVSCPYHCKFCYGTNLHCGSYQPRKVENVIAELQTIPAETVFIVDSDFLVQEEWLKQFIHAVLEKGIRKKYICYGRADFIVSHAKLIQQLCSIGFLFFLVGIESVDNSALERYHKLTDRNINEKCIDILHHSGAVCVALMIADLSFHKRDFDKIYQWTKQQNLKYVSVQVLTPIPPTDYYLQNRGKFITSNPEKWNLTHPVMRPEHMPVWLFLLYYRFLAFRLYLQGRKRGAYRFVTAKYVFHAVKAYFKRLHTVS